MLRFTSRSALVLVLLVAATGCGARAVAESPAKTAATCANGQGGDRAEAECLRQVLGDLAALDSNELRLPRRTAVTAWGAQGR